MGAFIDLSGQKFGRLTVVRLDGQIMPRRPAWLCLCDCGNTRRVPCGHLKNGHTQSCGCLGRERRAAANTKHGQASVGARSAEYKIWLGMMARCRATSGRLFHYYGSRGITVCERWRTYENFLADMGERPPGKSIDRIDNDGNYEPGNCRWATQSEQVINSRRWKKGA